MTVSGMMRETLTNLLASLTHNPERNACATTLLLVVALNRRFCAACSVKGAITSPRRKVSTDNVIPILVNETAMLRIDIPETRITVYSELTTSCESANKVPISAATGRIS